jgi:hypothetical protein
MDEEGMKLCREGATFDSELVLELVGMERFHARERFRPKDFEELDDSIFEHNLFFRVTLFYMEAIQTTTN